MIGPPEPESRFCPPTALCPHPEWWTSTDDHSTEIEVSELIAGLVRGLQPGYVVETGSAWGQTAEAIGRALQANGHGRCVSLEPDAERCQFTRDRCAGLPVDVLPVGSLDYTPDGIVDFAFFDSLFPLRVPEFRRFRPHMRKGTIVAFHDTKSMSGGGQLGAWPDLRTQLDVELSRAIRLMHLPTPRGITLGEVI